MRIACAVLVAVVLQGSRSLEQQDLRKALAGLDRLADFFLEDAESLNTDALFGLRMGQGQLQVIRDLMGKRTSLLPQSLTKVILRIYEKMNSTVSKAYPYVQRRENKYFQDFWPLLARPYPAVHRTRHIKIDGAATRDLYGPGYAYNERHGDNCFMEIIGNTNSHKGSHCSISEECWTFMNSPESHGYYATHQLLYYLIGRIFCRPQINSLLRSKTLDEVYHDKCQRIYEDSLSISKNNYVTEGNMDLFIEQNLLCALAGFDDFLTAQTLNLVLSWQDDRLGCFPKVQRSDKPLHEDENRQRRRKRIGTVMKDGCESHISGLAMGIFGCYVRKAVSDLY